MANSKKEISGLFDSSSFKDFLGQSFGKFGRKTILKKIIASSILIVFLILVLGGAWLFAMRSSEAQALRDIELFHQITNPNVEEMNARQEGNGLFEGILRFERYKVIEGIPVDWGEEAMTYSIFGGVSRLTNNHSYIQIENEESRQIQAYDSDTKQRVLSFYHPRLKYSELSNGLRELSRYSDGTVAEVALSFDQAYSLAEILKRLPEDITLTWNWVDTYSSHDFKQAISNVENEDETELVSSPELANQVYGFKGNQLGSEELFIENIQLGLSIEGGKYFGEYKRIHNLLKGDSSQLMSADIRIIGVVVTGSVERLQSLESLQMVRASALGVTVIPN